MSIGDKVREREHESGALLMDLHISRNVVSLVDVVYEYLQNANDAAHRAGICASFRMQFRPHGFSVRHTAGTWSEDEVVAFLTPGVSTKTSDGTLTGEMGIGAFSAFKYARIVNIDVPTGESRRCIEYEWRRGIVSDAYEISDAFDPASELSWSNVRDPIDYASAVDELQDLVHENQDSLHLLLGIPFLHYTSSVEMELEASGDRNGHAKLHALIQRDETDSGNGTQVCRVTTSINGNESISELRMHIASAESGMCTVAFPDRPWRDSPRFFRTLPLQRSEDIGLDLYIDGPFDHDTSRRLSGFRKRNLDLPRYRGIIDAVVSAIVSHRSEDNSHLAIFPSEPATPRGWKLVSSAVIRSIAEVELPIVYADGGFHPVSELLFADVLASDIPVICIEDLSCGPKILAISGFPNA